MASLMPFFRLAGIGKLASQHQLDALVLRHGLRCLLGHLGRLVVLLGIAVGIHLALVSALGIFPAHGDHQLVGLHRLVGLVLLAVHIGQPVEEDGAIVLFRFGVLAVRVAGLLYQALQGLRRLVVVAQGVVDQGFVEADFERIRGQRLGLLQRGQRLLVVALAALDLRDAQIGLRVLRVGSGDGLKVLERRAKLVVIQQRLRQAPFRVQVIRFHLERLGVGIDGILVLLELVVAHAQRVVHFGACGHRRAPRSTLRSRASCRRSRCTAAPGSAPRLLNWDRCAALP